jgi:DNA-binding response OmpR family regulator
MEQKTILVVDDEEGFTDTVRMMLEVIGGYKVISAANGKEAVKKAHLIKPDLILMDIRMPEMDGLHALQLLKEDDETVAIPVIMLTACDEDIYKMEAAQLYDEDYLVKPVKAADLVARVEKTLKRRKQK